MTKKLQLSRKVLIKILNFCEKRDRFSVKYEEKEVYITCPKLIDLCDEYTQKIIKQNRDKIGTVSGACRADVGTEVRSKKEEDLKARAGAGEHIHKRIYDSERPPSWRK